MSCICKLFCPSGGKPPPGSLNSGAASLEGMKPTAGAPMKRGSGGSRRSSDDNTGRDYKEAQQAGALHRGPQPPTVSAVAALAVSEPQVGPPKYAAPVAPAALPPAHGFVSHAEWSPPTLFVSHPPPASKPMPTLPPPSLIPPPHGFVSYAEWAPSTLFVTHARLPTPKLAVCPPHGFVSHIDFTPLEPFVTHATLPTKG